MSPQHHDLTVLDLTHPHLQPLRDPRRAAIALGNRANIDAVMVDGRLLVAGGRCGRSMFDFDRHRRIEHYGPITAQTGVRIED